jgi:predicted RNA binding protein YcfA (HicA-like mRNA interferase family)
MNPVSRDNLIRRLRKLGFEGPIAGGKHSIMIRGHFRLPIPNPHQQDIGVGLLKRILRTANITEEEWNSTR